MWLSGDYPRALDGLCKILSLDMRVLDPAWIGMKLRKLLDFPEPLGDFMAFVPGQQEAADLALDDGLRRAADHPPLRDARRARRGRHPAQRRWASWKAPAPKGSAPVMAGATCPECGNPTLIRKDGCDYCTACGYVGVCG